MSLRQQIVSGFAVLIVPLAIVALVSLSTVSRLGGAVEAVLSENQRSLTAASEMDTALERLDSAALSALLGRPDDAEAIAAPALGQFREALAVAEGNLTIEGEGAIVADLGAGFERVGRAWQALSAADGDAARTTYADAFVPAFDDTRDALGRLRVANREAAAVASQDASQTARVAFWSVAIGALFALAIGAWAALRLSRQIAVSARS